MLLIALMPFLIGERCWLCSFHSSYPSWEPDPQGKQFLLNLRAFEDRMLQRHGPRLSYSPPRAWCGAYADWNSPYTIEIQQRNHPYLLDWYYKSQSPQNGSTSNHLTEDPKVVGMAADPQHQQEDLWTPPYFGQHEARFEESLGRGESTVGRLQSHLGASTSSAPWLFRESLFKQHESCDMGPPSRSHWWARNSPDPIQNQTSFIEPPEFGIRGANDHYYENRSDRSTEECEDGEEHLGWRLPQRPSFLPSLEDDIEAGDVSLHFDDVYSKPPETPRVDLQNMSSGWWKQI